MSAMIQQDVPLQIIRPRAQRVLPSHLMTRAFDDKLTCRSPDHLTRIATADFEPNQQHIIPQSESPFHAEVVLMQPALSRVAQPVVSRAGPNVVRPIALKVAHPIPKSAVEQFYNEAYVQGLQADQVHAATVLAQDWHRKWTQQDEEGHTMPEAEADYHPEANYSEVHLSGHANALDSSTDNYSYTAFDRMAGAKNPSPVDLQEDLYFERKRLRFVASRVTSSLSPVSHSSDSIDLQPPSSKRRVLGFETAPMQVRAVSPELVAPQGVFKPLALRVQRPQAMDVATAINILTSRRTDVENLVPEDITKDINRQGSALSPLTISSYSGKYALEEDEEEYEAEYERTNVPMMISHVTSIQTRHRSSVIDAARTGVLQRLAITGGDVVADKDFLSHLELLKSFYKQTGSDTRFTSNGGDASEGMWLTLTKSTFFGNLGPNDEGDPMYTLGRMSFDMFSPTRLVCSLQGNFNSVQKVTEGDRSEMQLVPKALLEEVKTGDSELRTYDIVTAFTVEPNMAAWPNAPNKDVRRPIKALMTTRGYTLPDPENPNRQSVWITGGRIEPNDDPVDQREWNRQFAKNPPKHAFGEKAKLLAVKLLMGATIPTNMEADGSMEYTFTRPLGGHGMAYVDTLYVDESLRIVQGHRGTIFVFSKLPEQKQ